MSFSAKVKGEIAQVFGESRHCRIAFLSAIINSACFVNEKLTVEPRTDNGYVSGAFECLIKTDFSGLSNRKLLQATGFLNDGVFERKMNRLIVKRPCCKRAYLRAAFLCGGSVNGPGKPYHLEFAAETAERGRELIELLRAFELSPKGAVRKNRPIVYLKEGEQVAEVLNIINAHKSLLEFENKRAEKEMGNSINRIANCESANIDKSVSAAVKQIEDIKTIANTVGLAALPEQLRECARVRLENPELSLAEIGQRLLPPISKSGVSHRLRKIAQIAVGANSIRP